jgi:hypothetical protein
MANTTSNAAPRNGDAKPGPTEPRPPRLVEDKLVRRVPTKTRREASRRNAKRSTGPRTERGKAASSANAVKHGVCARPFLPYGLFARENLLRNALAGESKAEFEKLLDALDENFAPADVFERLLVEKMAILLWRTRRLHRYERSKVDGQINVQKIISRVHALLRTAGAPETTGRARRGRPAHAGGAVHQIKRKSGTMKLRVTIRKKRKIRVSGRKGAKPRNYQTKLLGGVNKGFFNFEPGN